MEDNVFEEMAKRYDTDERKKLAKVIVNELRSELVRTFYQGERIFMNQDASLFLSTSVK